MSSHLLRPRRVETLIWIALIAALAAGIGIESDWGRRFILPLKQTEQQPTSFSKPSLTEPFSLPAADTFLDIALRPIFVVSRRPAPTITVEAPKPHMKKDQFMLTGTTIVPEGKFAHLVEKAGKKSHVVLEGKEINGLLLKEVKVDRVVLTQHDDTEIVMLYVSKAPPIPLPQTPAQTSQQASPQMHVQTPTQSAPQAAPQAATPTPPANTSDPASTRPARSTTLPIPFKAPSAK